MSDNWFALAVAVLSPKEINVSTALVRMGIKVSHNKNTVEINSKQFEKIERMRNEGISWNDIAKQMNPNFTGGIVRDKFFSLFKEKATKDTAK